MLNKNERMEKLNAMGINTGKFFTVALENGTKVHLIIDENGNPKKVNEVICFGKNENAKASATVKDAIANQIVEDGYVGNTKLYRRFVMAQMFQALNYVSWDKKRTGYNAWLKRFGIKYQFEMMLEEIRVLSKLEVKDTEAFIERSRFFTKEVIAKTMEDYVDQLEKHINTLKTYKCKGLPYKKIKGKDVFVADLHKKIYSPMRIDISRTKRARSYAEIHKIVSSFKKKMVAPYYGLGYGMEKSNSWIDAYKGEGAFYTLKNLLMFHNCGIEINKHMVYGAAAVSVLNKRLDEYQGEGWRMFALMKKVIADNNFDYQSRMSEIYNA
jgi:hypothetical protein